MDHFVALTVLAIGLFAVTNIDDIFVLLGFYANPRFRPRQIAAGQYLGIAVLYATGVVAGVIALALAPAYVGLLGLVPLAVGLKQLLELLRGDGDGEDSGDGGVDAQALTMGGGKILAVAGVTLANGGDNISIYTPVFATRSLGDVALIGLVFLAMTAVWLAAAQWLVNHRTIGEPIRAYGPKVVPFALIGLGTWILYEANTLALVFG